MKVVCKKYLYDNHFLEFKVDHVYDALYKDNDICWILSNNSAFQCFKYNINYSNTHKLFSDYFYTLEECRKIKLKKINNL